MSVRVENVIWQLRSFDWNDSWTSQKRKYIHAFKLSLINKYTPTNLKKKQKLFISF